MFMLEPTLFQAMCLGLFGFRPVSEMLITFDMAKLRHFESAQVLKKE